MIKFRSASDARAQLYFEIPRLAHANWRIRSPLDTEYQCIAYAACRTDKVWWPWDHPRYYWPPGFQKFPVSTAVPTAHFVDMFEKRFGYRRCIDSNFEFGYQRVAIYANASGVTHMSRQHLFGKGWLSKLGEEEDILHQDAEDVGGDIHPMAGQYGDVTQYMKRSWWTALKKLCLFHCFWASLKFRVYRAVVRWDLT